jgi:hypothetical protein
MIASPSGSQTPARNFSPREAELGWTSAYAQMTPEGKKEEKNLDAGARSVARVSQSGPQPSADGSFADKRGPLSLLVL